MAVRTLHPVPLTRAAFAAFGDVVDLAAVGGDGGGKAANQGSALRFDFAAALHNARPHAQANLAVFRCAPRPLPFPVVLLERHPQSSQLFAPLSVSRYVVLAAPGGADGPDIDHLQAFLAGPGQCVNYKPGTWHHPMIALDRPAEFLMLAWEDGGADDCDERALAEPFTLHVPPLEVSPPLAPG